jgi:GDP-mannose 6-dehydrogenase
VLPGTIHGTVVPILEKTSGKPVGPLLRVCSNPEFLREGSSIRDFYEPPFTLIGADDESAAEIVRALYESIEARVFVTPVRVAEMVKYACNGFHALKVAFANEVGVLCKALNIDSHEVMEIFTQDRKLNLSSAYLRPGFAFGGSCLPKDMRALLYRAQHLDIGLPLLAATLESNRKHLERAFQMILATRLRRVGILGLSFKAGTDDLRESPMVALTEMLIGRGLEVTIHDPDVQESHLTGANREYIEREIPHIWGLMKANREDVLRDSELVVVGSIPHSYDLSRRLKPHQVVIDLVRAFEKRVSDDERYLGLCW